MSNNNESNTNTTVLVTGATGLVGRQVVGVFQRSGFRVVGQGFSRARPPMILKADMEKSEEIETLVDEVKPQIIIHCAANRIPELCEQNPDQARRTNVQSTQTIAKAARAHNAFLLYLSTDYVFPGTVGEAPYEADEATNPPNMYGALKREGEVTVLDASRDSGLAVVLRLPVLYGSAVKSGESSVNALVDMLVKVKVKVKAAKEGEDRSKVIKVDDWSQRYPTNTRDVARVCHDVAVRYYSTYLNEADRVRELPRILQFTSEDRLTKYGMCEKLAQVLGLSLDGLVVRDEQGGNPGAPVQRPYDTHLSTKLLRDLGINVETVDFGDWWREELLKTPGAAIQVSGEAPGA